MASFVPVSRERHSNKRWRRNDSYAFTARTSLVGLVAAELPNAAVAMPLAFTRESDRFMPVALLGVDGATSLFVAPDGRWLGRYIPSAFRAHPFTLARGREAEAVLCVDEAYCVSDDGGPQGGEPFFTEEGGTSEPLGRVLDFLRQVEANRELTGTACEALSRHALLKPWSVSVQVDRRPYKIEGLFQVDEAVLSQLSDAAFLELRHAGALSLAYCQMLSAQNLGLLGQLAKDRVSSPPPTKVPGFSLADEEQLQFDWDRLEGL